MAEDVFTDIQIRKYLDSIKQSIIDDVGLILPVYSGSMSGFFAVPRLLFPEIDGLGALITGKPELTVLNITTYLKEVMSKVDNRYAKYAVFMTFVYRHGLLHQHKPKVFEYKKKDIGWMFNINHVNNPLEVQREFHLRFGSNFLQLDMNVFYQDTIDSIEIIYDMITDSYRRQFSQAVKQQFAPLNKTSILKNKKYKQFIKASDFNFFNELNLHDK